MGNEKASWVERAIFRRALVVEDEADEKNDDSQFMLFAMAAAVARAFDDDGLKESAVC